MSHDPSSETEAREVLRAEELSITFAGLPEGFQLVDRVSFSVKAGQTLCLVGESGCGKSIVSLSLMGLLARPPARITSGRILFEGADLLTLDPEALADLRGNRMTMIFQEPMTSLNPAFTIGDQLTEVILRHRNVSSADAEQLAIAVLQQVRMPAPESRLAAYPHQMSGGMRQRVMIAMALANSPRLLIADEPTTALDVTIQAQILRLVRDLQRNTGTAMVLVTHDLGVVAEVADHVAVMYAGRIVEQGPVAQIFQDPQHPYTIGLMGSLPSLGQRQSRLTSIPGAVPPPRQWPKGCRFSTRCPFADARCRNEVPALTDIGSGHAVACFKAPIETIVGSAA
ncbi:MAG: ABC transporter ATP-binding protein [Hyphomicrobiales bacterium]|jgi:peptide/nickel transport system ATP-binding protein|nr:ABC transporter ATP-binding protein [Hyphomicrobiales bacterium]